MKTPHYAKEVEEKGLRSERGRKESDRSDYMTNQEFLGKFKTWQHEYYQIPKKGRPHFMDWFMETHGDYFTYYLMQPIFTSGNQKAATDAMKEFMRYSKQVPKTEVDLNTGDNEATFTPEELVATMYSIFPPEEVVAKGLDMMGLSIKDFREFVASRKN